MKGAIILCTVHKKVHNAQKREWQEVSQEMLDELLEMAQELGGVDIWEGQDKTIRHRSLKTRHARSPAINISLLRPIQPLQLRESPMRLHGNGVSRLSGDL